MKNLANCKPSEFVKQTNRIKHSAEAWLKATEIPKIRADIPEIPKGTPEAKARKMIEDAARRNFGRILDAILDKHPEETLALLALCCFVEPENVDDHDMSEYLDCVSDIIGNESVLRFFTSLIRLGQTNIFGA